jgi:indolepyruvate ferredoxin oxidoreductase alpha subunit
VAHAAVLCPSFFRAEIVQNPGVLDRLVDRLRSGILSRLQPA